MKKPRTTTYIAFSLASMTATLLCCAMGLGLLSNGHRERLEARAHLCETIAMQLCTLLSQEKTDTLDRLTHLLVDRNPDLLSLAIQHSSGQMVASTSEHSRLWKPIPSEMLSETHVKIPLFVNDKASGTCQICLTPIYANALDQALHQMHLPLLAFCVGAGFLVFRLYLKKTLKHLDPSSVVPDRVKKVLDILSDGVVMTDERGQIVLANETFQAATTLSTRSLLGKNLSIFKWIDPSEHQEAKDLPWTQMRKKRSTHRNVPLMLEHLNEPDQYHSTLVSTTPITGAKGENRGMLVSLTDVTELERTNRKLVEVSRLAGKAEIATDILHNVGNILDSVNVSTTLLSERHARSKLAKLRDVSHMITDHHNDPGHFLTEDEQGKQIPANLTKMIDKLLHEQTGYDKIVQDLEDHVNHLSEIVSSQQSYAQTITCEVPTSLPEVVERAIAISAERLHSRDIGVTRETSKIGIVTLDESRLLQILTNLICNASDALEISDVEEKKLIIRLLHPEKSLLRIEVIDNGVGIAPENLDKIFQHGFTTKENGHGFGLHSSVLAAKEMGGSLSAHSQGIGHGASFVCDLPFGSKESVNDYDKKYEPSHSGC